MKRFLTIAAAFLVGFALFVPTVLAASALPHTGRVLISTAGDITLPAGEHADLVVVVNGMATIQGEVNTIVAIDGAVNLSGARTETVVAVRSPVEVGPDTVVLGDVMTLDSLVHQTGNAQIRGAVTDMAAALIGIGAVLAPALVLVWLGFGLATLVAGLLLAGLAGRQVRRAEDVIRREPVLVVVAGIAGAILLPVLAILLIATLVGAPLGLGILLGALPLLAFLGYLVAAIWIGDLLLRSTSRSGADERPFAAAVLGVVLLELLAIIPILSIAVMLASLVGFGAVLVLGFRVLRGSGPSIAQPSVIPSTPAPVAG